MIHASSAARGNFWFFTCSGKMNKIVTVGNIHRVTKRKTQTAEEKRPNQKKKDSTKMKSEPH
jgi:hypothetical protein